jgi:hypothetical protein
MTVRVMTLKGADAGAYYVEALPNYYLDSGEQRGRWLGDGAAMLGFARDVDDEPFLALMAGMDPRWADRHLGRAYDDKSMRGFDVTRSRRILPIQHSAPTVGTATAAPLL